VCTTGHGIFRRVWEIDEFRILFDRPPYSTFSVTMNVWGSDRIVRRAKPIGIARLDTAWNSIPASHRADPIVHHYAGSAIHRHGSKWSRRMP